MPRDNRPQWVAYKKNLYQERKRKGLCATCGGPLPKDGTKYVNCPDCRLRVRKCRAGIGVNKDPLSGLDRNDPNQPTSADDIYRPDTEEEITERQQRQNRFRDNVVAAEKAGMTYGQYMAQKYMEEHNMALKKGEK